MTVTVGSSGESVPGDPALGGGSGGWVAVCALAELDVDRGAAVLVGRSQIALFLVATGPAGDHELFALANRDPWSGANVLSRGIVGSAGDVLYVASPMYKQRFDLRTGRCLEDGGVTVATWPVRVVGGRVEIALEEIAPEG